MSGDEPIAADTCPHCGHVPPPPSAGWRSTEQIVRRDDDIVVRIMQAVQSCPCRRRPVIGSQIMGGCERCDAEQLGADEIVRLRAEVERQRDDMSTMHRTVVHDCCVQVQSERRLVDQLADALKTVQHDRPSAHTDNVWAVINHALNAYEEARRDQ